MAKVKFHRHKCEDTQIVQDELNEIESLKNELKLQLSECIKERAQLKDRM